MTAAEIILSIISLAFALVAVVVSIITAYRALYARFQAEVFSESRVTLSHHHQVPSLVIGYEISNLGAKSGAIDDMLLLVRHSLEGTRIRNDYWFKPYLSRENYSVYESYEDTDFRPFQSIFVSKDSSLTRYIVFIPDSRRFSPESGDIELQLFSRISGRDEWREASATSFSVTEAVADAWRDPKGQSLLVDTVQNKSYREQLIRRLSDRQRD